MSERYLSLSLFCLLLMPFGRTAVGAAEVKGLQRSQWAYPEGKGRLVYKTTGRGDKIMDFSSAGYMGGEARLPAVSVSLSVEPSGGDDTAVIQKAIDVVSRRPLSGIFRGTVLLKPGQYSCSGSLTIETSGVVLRGSAPGPEGTVLKMTGAPHIAILVSGRANLIPSKTVGIQEQYIPAGSTSLVVQSEAVFERGDNVLVSRPVTANWVHFMGMDGLTRNGRKETWLAVSSRTTAERTVTAVQGNRLILDIPLSDSFDAAFLSPPGGTVTKIIDNGRISQVGLESLRIVAPPQAVAISEPHHRGIRLQGAQDCWVRDVSVVDTVDSVGVGRDCRRITVQNVSINHSVSTQGAAKPADFSTEGSQVLFRDCSSTGDNLFYFVTGARVTGPNVLLNCVFHGNGHIQPHARWATGLLIDNCEVPEGGIDLMNRGEMGSGHGWTSGWSVAWNCTAKTFIIQQPPGALNWAIGCCGTRLRQGMPFSHKTELVEGIFDSPGVRVEPASLYSAQLGDRIGPEAVKALGY